MRTTDEALKKSRERVLQEPTILRIVRDVVNNDRPTLLISTRRIAA